MRNCEKVILLISISVKLFKHSVFPHEYLLFPPQLSAVHFEGGQISIIRSPQNVRSDGQKLHRQWQESTETVELENFR